MTIHFVPVMNPQEVQATKPLWKPLIKKYAAKTRENAGLLLDRIRKGEVEIALAWDIDRSDVVAFIGWRLVTEGEDRVGEVVAFAGSDFVNVMALAPEIEAFLRDHQKCNRVRTIGRMGWARVMKPHGYRVTRVMLEKDLST